MDPHKGGRRQMRFEVLHGLLLNILSSRCVKRYIIPACPDAHQFTKAQARQAGKGLPPQPLQIQS